MQFNEWIAFFRIREELRKEDADAAPPAVGAPPQQKQYGATKNEQKRLGGDILRSFQAYQQRHTAKAAREKPLRRGAGRTGQ